MIRPASMIRSVGASTGAQSSDATRNDVRCAMPAEMALKRLTGRIGRLDADSHRPLPAQHADQRFVIGPLELLDGDGAAERGLERLRRGPRI
jgi:hypothetical protein